MITYFVGLFTRQATPPRPKTPIATKLPSARADNVFLRVRSSPSLWGTRELQENPSRRIIHIECEIVEITNGRRRELAPCAVTMDIRRRYEDA